MSAHARHELAVALVLFASTSMLALFACDDGNAIKAPIRTQDSGPPPGQDSSIPPGQDGSVLPDGAPTDCVQNPKTHEEIINGCTDAVKITKNPTLPLLLSDGGLPTLP